MAMTVAHRVVRSSPPLRRGLRAALAASALTGTAAALLMVPHAAAATDPCAASEIAKTIGSVAANTGSYLDAHPQTNQALTTVAGQPAGPQSVAALKTYFDANPQAGQDLQTIQQPLTSISTRCKLPISIPQVLGMMQAAQQGGGLAGGLPGTASAAQAVAGTTGIAATGQTPAVAVPAATGPLPGPAAATTR
jgi:hemophore